MCRFTTRKIFLIAILYCSFFTDSVMAETVYRWVDQWGIPQFGSRPPQDKGFVSIQLKTSKANHESTTRSIFEQLQALERDKHSLKIEHKQSASSEKKQRQRKSEDQYISQWLGQWDESINRDRHQWIEHCKHNRGTHCEARTKQHHLVKSTAEE